jgi:hypothetical protein
MKRRGEIMQLKVAEARKEEKPLFTFIPDPLIWLALAIYS